MYYVTLLACAHFVYYYYVISYGDVDYLSYYLGQNVNSGETHYWALQHSETACRGYIRGYMNYCCVPSGPAHCCYSGCTVYSTGGPVFPYAIAAMVVCSTRISCGVVPDGGHSRALDLYFVIFHWLMRERLWMLIVHPC